MKTIYAEDLNYWNTSPSADNAIAQAIRDLKSIGADVKSDGFLSRDTFAAYMIEFVIDGVAFRYIEPVLQSRTGNVKAARIQAAATLKHTIKARCVEARRKGAKWAFAGDALLPDGRSVSEAVLNSTNVAADLFRPALGSGLVLDSGD